MVNREEEDEEEEEVGEGDEAFAFVRKVEINYINMDVIATHKVNFIFFRLKQFIKIEF